jgi:hypothetical protein
MSRSPELAGRRVGGRRPQVGAGESSKLVALGKRFARFRREHERGARIPDELRSAALELLREMAPAEVYRTCGISFGQVMAWKEAEARHLATPGVRVFSVVDEEPAPRLAPEVTASAAAPALELRLGPWAVSVRLVGPAPSERG